MSQRRIKVGEQTDLSPFHWVRRAAILTFTATYLNTEGAPVSETFREFETAIIWANKKRADVIRAEKAPTNTASIHRFTVSYHDGVEWKWVSFDMLAMDEAQVRAYVDDKRSPECRTTPHRIEGDPLDSLTIENQGAVSLPLELT
jgi:hypothetical protein